jgi:hypothetical protein
MAYLKWVEPWGGYNFVEDTGFCNRLFHWELAYQLNEINNFKFKILLEDYWWPELEYLELPYTEWWDKHKPTNTDIDRLTPTDLADNKRNRFINYTIPIDSREMETRQDFVLSDDVDYYPTCGYNFTRQFEEQFDKIRPLQLVSLKNKQLEKEIIEKTKGVVGIHIRRGIGVKPHDKDGAIEYVDDKVYTDIMDSILELNPNQRFYISADVPKAKLQYFYDNYDCFTWDVLNVDKYKVKQKYKILHKHTFANVVDLMMLSNTSFLVKVLSSSWSNFAQLYRGSYCCEAYHSGVTEEHRGNPFSKENYLKGMDGKKEQNLLHFTQPANYKQMSDEGFTLGEDRRKGVDI